MAMAKKIVVIGGGTGLANLLRGLKKYDLELCAIVTMTDDGASTGTLRKQFKILPPGDIRSCIAALSDEEEILTKLFQYRFEQGRGLAGHALGNLILLAMAQICGGFEKGTVELSRILEIKGDVLPSTLEHVELRAKLKSGKTVAGETQIAKAARHSPIQKITLSKKAKAYKEVVPKIKAADAILIGPGSLFTSIIPNFLIDEITKTVVQSRAKKIYIANVSTERGGTEKMTIENHLNTLISHSHHKILDFVLVNSRIIHTSNDQSKLGAIHNITETRDKIGRYGIIRADVVDLDQPLFHDSKRLAKKIAKII